MKSLLVVSFICSVTHALALCPKQVLKQEEGEFTSPGYTAGRYPNDITCEYVIKAKKGFHLLVTFLHFDLEYSDGADTDYVQVSDGRPENRLREKYYSGRRKTPFSFVSKTNRIYLKFVSDSEFRFKGFKAAYKAIKPAHDRCLVPDIANAKLSCHEFDDGLADKCDVTCNRNYTLLGDKTITCENSTFSKETKCGPIPRIAKKCDEDIASCPYTIDEIVQYYLSRDVLEDASEEKVKATLQTVEGGIKIEPVLGRSKSSIRITCEPKICAYQHGRRVVSCSTYTSKKMNPKLRGQQICLACYHCQIRKCGIIVIPFG